MKVNSHRRARPGEPARRRFAPFRVRDWRVPTKLAAVLVLPAVAFLVIAGVQINSSVSTARQTESFAQGIKVGRELTALVHDLQTERDRTAGVLAQAAKTPSAEPVAIGPELTADYATTDAGFTAFFSASKALSDTSGTAAGAKVIANDVTQLHLVRDGVRNRWLRQSAVFDQYSAMIQHLFNIVPADPDVGGDTDLKQSVLSLADLAQVKELTAQLRGKIFAATTAGTFSPDDFETFAQIQARQVAAVEQFRSQASAAHLARYDESLRGQAVSSVSRLQETVLSRARGVTVDVPADTWWRSSTAELELIRSVEQDLLEDAIQGAANRYSIERRNAFLAIATIVLIMMLALLLSWLIGRSMARSLRQLRTQALDVAQHRLPEAIHRLRNLPRGETITVDTTTRVRSTDEIGEVADAFTAVHRSAVSLAVEQAIMRRNVNAMFINLARRSQTLVERQLQLLDSLEAAETDPDQLASLFRLDHLATRMRRNDENLLVLAGSDSARRWAEPVSLSAVSMAAMAEIEQYARIRHDVSNDVFVVGHAVADLVHLLAELLENATTFSPPESVVAVTGWPSTSGRDATIIIEDHGLGMTEGGLLEANERVNSPVAIDVAASERMGLVVVGHLAARHGIAVRLNGSEAGVVAYVTLPASLLSAPPDGGGLYGSATGRLTIQRQALTAEAIAGPPATGRRPAPELTGPPRPTSAPPAPPRPTSAPPASTPPPIRPSSPEPAPDNAPAVASATPDAPTTSPPPAWPPVPAGTSLVRVNGGKGGLPTRKPASRSEDIIGAASGGESRSAKNTRWWSKEGAAAAAAAAGAGAGEKPAPLIPAQRAPVTGGVSGAGLPIRVPLAQLPSDTTKAEQNRQPDPPPSFEPDPDQVSSMLTRFYSGVHRATTEDDVPTVPINEQRGARRDPEPTSP
jgi:hypothetical protein